MQDENWKVTDLGSALPGRNVDDIVYKTSFEGPHSQEAPSEIAERAEDYERIFFTRIT